MAQLSKPPIPLKMYKHFAAVTVVLTSGIAMFADGENREARSQSVHQSQSGTSSSARTASPQLVRRDLGRPSSWGDSGEDFSAAYGTPTDNVVSQSGGSSGGASRNHGYAAQTNRSLPGYSQRYLDSISEEQYAELMLRHLQRVGNSTEQQQADQQAALERASARRGGATTSADE